MQYQSRHLGITLLEVLLVLAIGGSVMVMGSRFYQMLKRDADAQSLLYNVDILFQAASNYYVTQCSRQWDPVTGPKATTGTLDQASTASPFVVSMADLETYMQTPLQSSSLVDNSVAENYVVQFNPMESSRNLPVDAGTVSIGRIELWKIQVAVKLLSPALLQAYKSSLQAQCASSLVGDVVTPCQTAVSGSYLVWERLPSFANPMGLSDYWVSMPLVRQFKQLYTTYPMNYLVGSDHSETSQQRYLCGG